MYMTMTNLQEIMTKVRRLTRSPSTNQLSDDDIKQYVNTFVLYDFPVHIQLSFLHTTFNFYTEPYKDVYDTNTTNPTDPLYQFNNRYTSVNQPVYMAGYQAFYSQSEEQFYSIYPRINFISSIGTVGNGATTSFSGTLSATPILIGNVLFSSVDINNRGLALIDVPSDPFDGTGTLIIPNDPLVSFGTINYITGVFSFIFPFAPANGIAINSQTVPYQPSLPQAMLFYENKFILRPVPDQPYKIQIEARRLPTELLDNNQSPELYGWWQYIAYGTAKKVFEDRGDEESVTRIMPEFSKQEQLVLTPTILQLSNQRSSTIYTEQTSSGNGYNGWGWGGGSY